MIRRVDFRKVLEDALSCWRVQSFFVFFAKRRSSQLLVIYTSVSSSTTTVMLCVYHNARYTLGDSITCAATLGLGLGLGIFFFVCIFFFSQVGCT
jgi:hypothetical protein